jgi:hypothetical protein
MNQASPPPVTQVQSYAVRQSIFFVNQVMKDFDTLVLPQGTSFPGSIQPENKFAAADLMYSPFVYELLNNTYNFTAPENVKTFPATKKAGLIDASKGGYKNFSRLSDIYRNGLPLYNALWPVPGQSPDTDVWSPDYTGNIKPIRVNRPGLVFSSDRVQRTENYTEERLITVWDWDDPAYCRFMLQELGFSASDLNP